MSSILGNLDDKLSVHTFSVIHSISMNSEYFMSLLSLSSMFQIVLEPKFKCRTENAT